MIRAFFSVLVLFIVSTVKLKAQTDNYKLLFSYALQGTEERIFGLNPWLTEEIVSRNNKKRIPSMYVDFGLSKRLFRHNNFSLSTGFKYAYEWNNSYRNYNHCTVSGYPCFYILLFIDSYGYHMLGNQTDLTYVFHIKEVNISAGLSISPMFRFLTYYDSRYKYLWKFEYFTSELTPKIGVIGDKYEIGIFGRVWMRRKTDRTIYPEFSNLGHPSLSDEYLDINPWKLGAYFNYRLPF